MLDRKPPSFAGQIRLGHDRFLPRSRWGAVYYNFARIHKTLRITPAMAAGVSDHVWSLEEIVMMADSYMPQPSKRGPYKKRIEESRG
jgi:hypothetical protein